MNEHLFREAEAAVGDPEHAIHLVRQWADAVPGRRRLLIQGVRHRVDSLPVLDEMVDGVFELDGR
jgi:hypothetical protein